MNSTNIKKFCGDSSCEDSDLSELERETQEYLPNSSSSDFSDSGGLSMASTSKKKKRKQAKPLKNMKGSFFDCDLSIIEKDSKMNLGNLAAKKNNAVPRAPAKNVPKHNASIGQSTFAILDKLKNSSEFNNFYLVKNICILISDLLIPRLSFSRLVKEVLSDVSTIDNIRVTPQFLEAIQEAAELYLYQFFQDAYLCTMHRERATLVPKDMQLAMRLRGASI